MAHSHQSVPKAQCHCCHILLNVLPEGLLNEAGSSIKDPFAWKEAWAAKLALRTILAATIHTNLLTAVRIVGLTNRHAFVLLWISAALVARHCRR